MEGPPDIENQNGGQPEAVFSDEEADVIIKVEKDPPPKATKGKGTNCYWLYCILLADFWGDLRIEENLLT